MQKILSFSFLILLGFNVQAQDNKLPPEALNVIAQGYGLDPDGRHIQALAAGQVYKARGPSDLKIIKHIKGEGGSKFQSSEDIANIDRPTEEELKQIEQALDKAYLENDKLIVIRTAPNLPKCDASKTQVTGTAMVNEKRLDSDVIFLDPKDMPKDIKVFGKSTSVYAYVSDKADGASLAAWSAGITCLPTRLRFFPSSRYSHTGIDALKNYDSDLHGTGVLDPNLKYLENRY